MSGKTLFPEPLVQNFGRRTRLGQQAVAALDSALARALDRDGDQRTLTLFAKWQALFGEPVSAKHRDAARVLFSLHTYFALVVKLIAAHVLSASAVDSQGLLPGPHSTSEDDIRQTLQRIDGGEFFRELGIGNFPEPDFPPWYLRAWNRDLAVAVQQLFNKLAEYSPWAREGGSEPARDLLKMLYQNLVPARLRHDLGEFYTPDWLASHVLNQVAYEGQRETRLLDPACGSGTFLVLAIQRLRARCRQERLSPQATLDTVLQQVVGIDLNPLAVLAARANYLLALGELLQHRTGTIDIPVYLADSILFPQLDNEACSQRHSELRAPPHHSPKEMTRLGTFDVVVGNPPWVGWESLPKDYRLRTQPLWEQYGLFPHRGMNAILGHGKKDLSLLMSYSVSDRFLRLGGKLGFVITQSAFKTAGAAQGFRRFRIGAEVPLRIERVDDLVDLTCFPGTGTRTSVFVWTKGEETTYPLEYHLWQKTAIGKSIRDSTALPDVLLMTRRLLLAAEPITTADVTSPWLTVRPEITSPLRRIRGQAEYQAHEGANTGGANAVYWVQVTDHRPDGSLAIHNITQGAKRRVEQVSADVEPDLVYPLLRGRDVRRWQAVPAASIILAQDPATRRGIATETMRRQYPKTYDYLQRFEELLRSRAAFRRYFTRRTGHGSVETGPFYSMFNVGQYTLARYKVVWHRMLVPLQAAAIGDQQGRPIVPQETHAFIACETEAEAYFLAGMMNSCILDFAARAYSQAGGKSFASPHLLDHLRVPRFDPANAHHLLVAQLSHGMHDELPRLTRQEQQQREEQLDEAAATVWEMGKNELDAIRRNLLELTKGDLTADND